ncbi:MAG: hypothetical protein IPQ21_12925 [Betaproteobacteria bacterium]|nr:hypothetical protein [Betaproteobacteria bacterium]
MITPSFDQTLIARAATGLYNLQLGSSTTDWALEWVNGGNGTVEDLVNQLFVRDFGTMSDADVAAMVVENVNITEPAPRRRRRHCLRGPKAGFRRPGAEGCDDPGGAAGVFLAGR